MAYKGDPEKDLMVDYLDHKTMSFQTLINALENFKRDCMINHIDPKDVPVVVLVKSDRMYYAIPWYGISVGIGSKGVRVAVEYYKEDKCMPIVPDVRPDGEGEYWISRGAGVPDISGFVKSKQGGERINAMVDKILGTTLHKSWLDYREYEPEWIQYKFHQDEFDMEKLDALSRANGGVLTEEIIRQCVRGKTKED